MRHLLLLVGLLLGFAAQAQFPINLTAFSSTASDRVVSTTTGPDGRFYLLGFRSLNSNVGTPPAYVRTAAGSVPFGQGGYFIAAYGASGQLEQQWSLSLSYEPRGLAVDQAGNFYLTGGGGWTFALEKLTRNLVSQWKLTYGTTGGAWGNRVLVDAQGNSYVAGTANNWSIFGLTLRPRSCCPDNDFIIKVNAQGTLQWVHAGDGGPNETLMSTGRALAFDQAGNVVMAGTITGTGTYGSTVLAGGQSSALVVKYSPAGVVLWARTYGTSTFSNYPSAVEANDMAVDEFDNIYLAGSFRGPQQFGTVALPSAYYSADALLLKLNGAGQPLWAQAGGYGPGTNLAASAYTSVAYRAGKVQAAGYTQAATGVYDSRPLVASYQAGGQLTWRTGLQAGATGTCTGLMLDANQTTHVAGYFKNTLQAGTTSLTSLGQDDGFYFQVLDSSRYQRACTIRGTVYADLDRNCQQGSGEPGLGGIILEAQPGPYYAITDSLGRYAIITDTGRYTVVQRLPQLPGRTIVPLCPAANAAGPIVLPARGSTVSGVDFGDQPPQGPYLVVEVAAGRRLRCAPGTTLVTYRNLGVDAAASAQVLVKLPRYVVFKSASQPYTQRADSTYVFGVGTLAPGQSGTIVIHDSVACGQPGIRGLTICTKAWITPDNDAALANWSQAAVRISGRVQAGNEVRFAVRNTGRAAMTDSLALRLYQGTDLALTHRFQLPAGDSLVLRVPAQRAVVRLEADQLPAFPLGPQASATVEVAALRPAGGAPSAALTARPGPTLPPTAAEECLPIVDSVDPNDKQVLPAGVSAQRYTPFGVPLRYQVRFQNTGTAEARRVVVVDTLDANLDVRTLRLGATSHPCRVTVEGRGRPVLVFTFSPIHLPEASRNGAGSQGFVQFSIQPKAGLADYTHLQNFADIYFDYNPAVRTDTTHNRLHDLPAVVSPALAVSYPAVLASPTVAAVAPGQGRAGTLVAVRGTRLSAGAGSQVYFNGVAAPVLSAAATSLTVRVPAGASTGRLKVVSVDGAAQSSTDFVVFQPPALAALTPAEARPGEVVTLSGIHFAPVAAQDTVWFNGVAAPVLSASATALQVAVPAGATTGRVRLSTLGGTVQSAQDFVVWYPPAISQLSPAKARVGTLLTLTGSNFASDAARNVVAFGTASAPVTQASAGRLQVRVPAGTAAGALRLDTPGGTATAGFTFLPAPVITAVSPTEGSAGTPVLLTGRNFQVDGQADTVYFAGVPARVLRASASVLQVLVPRGSRSGPLTVAGAGGRSSSPDAFTIRVLAPAEALAAYPNPTTGELTVDWTRAEFEVRELRLYNALGQLLEQHAPTQPTQEELPLHLASYPPGIYLLQVQTSAGPILKRLSLL